MRSIWHPSRRYAEVPLPRLDGITGLTQVAAALLRQLSATWCRAVWLTVITAILWPVMAAGQGTGSVRLDCGMGSVGSVTEFFRTPLVGQPKRDAAWKQEWQSDGQRLPDFPPGRQPVVDPGQAGPVTGRIETATVWAGIPDGGWPASTGVQASLMLVLFPVEVAAGKMWQSSGVMLQQGRTFKIEVAGLWSMHKDERWCGADGIAQAGPLGLMDPRDIPNHPTPICPMPNLPAGTLVGRIGGGPPFRIGCGGTFVADRDGELELMPNDVYDGAAPGQPCIWCNNPEGHLWNNQGLVRVLITTP